MKKRLMQGLTLTLICFLAMAAPSAAALSDTIVLDETDGGVEVSVKLAEKTEDEILSLSVSFQIDYTEGDGKGNAAGFVFDEALCSIVQEYRYDPDDGILTLYLSGRENLFAGQELELGTLEIAEPETGTLTARIGIAENRMEMVNAAHDALSGSVSVAGTDVISLGTPPGEPEMPSQEPETPSQEPETPPQESETLPPETETSPERPSATEDGGNETIPPQGDGLGGGNRYEGNSSRPVSGVTLPQTNTTVRPRPSEIPGESSGAETTAAAETENTAGTKESREETVSAQEPSGKDQEGFTAVDGEVSVQSGTDFLLFAGIVLAVVFVALGGCIVFDRRKRAARHRSRLARRGEAGNRSRPEKAQGHGNASGEPGRNQSAGSRGRNGGRPHKKE